MKDKFLKKAIAAALVLTFVSGAAPVQPVVDLFGETTITANALDEIEAMEIGSVEDWNTFAESVNNGTNYEGLTVVLTNDISGITTTVGTESHPFCGTFNGGNHTIDVAISDTSTQGTAPFREISNGAVIKNLTVTGTVEGTTHASGLVGFSRNGSSENPNTVENCIVNVDVSVPLTSGNRHMGGVVGHGVTSYLSIKDTVFGGTMSNNDNYAGGLMGWCDGGAKLTIDNCLFKGSYTGTANFHPIAICNTGATVTTNITDCYYIAEPTFTNTSFIAAEGTKVYENENEIPEGITTEVVTAADNNTYHKITGYQTVTSINSADDWNTFVNTINAGNTYEGQIVSLNADITVSTVAVKAFKGTFLGGGHKLTFNYTAVSDYAAPFTSIEDASIVCLEVDGTINTGFKYASAIAGFSKGNCLIKNCISRVEIISTIEGDGTHAGFVSICNDGGGTLNIENCLFEGSITGENTNKCGGFVGWRKGDSLNITNCLMAGTLDIKLDSNSATFSRNGVTPNNSYYRTSYGSVQGSAVGNMTDEQLVNALGAGWTIVDNKAVPIMDMTNIALSDVSNIQNEYLCTGENISVTPTITSVDGNVLTEGEDYTSVIKLNGQVVDAVCSPGTYSYTFSAVEGSGYNGEKTVSFEVKISKPTNIKQTDYTNSSAVLTWNNDDDVTGWKFQYSTDRTFSENVNTIDVDTASVTLENLDNDTDYYARVSALVGEFSSVWSDTVIFSTTSKKWIGFSSTDTHGHLPLDNWYRYSISEQIYKASELGEGRLITGIDFMKTGNSSTVRNIDIYMVHTDKEAFENSSDWINVTENDKVFSGSVKFVDGAWTTINFDKSFSYDGSHNVVLVVDDNTGFYYSTQYFGAVYGGSHSSLYNYSDSTNYDPTNNGYSVSISSYKSAVRFSSAADSYSITADKNMQNGTVSTTQARECEGKKVTFTVVPNEGYHCTSVSVNNGAIEATQNDNGTYSFTMPAENVTISAEFAENLNNTSEIQAATIAVGNEIVVNCSAAGGKSPYTYEVAYKTEDSSDYITAQDYSTNNIVKIKPESAAVYNIRVNAKDQEGNVSEKELTVTVNSALINNAAISAESVSLDTPITIMNESSGGVGSHKYANYYKETTSTKWTTIQKFTTDASVEFTPSKAGTYDICSKVKDESGIIVKKYFTVKVNAALSNKASLSAQSVSKGTAVTITNKASGGDGSYKYANYYKETTSTKWTTIQKFTTDESVEFTPSKIATYDICSKVKDESGTIVKKYFTVKVSDVINNNAAISAQSVSKGTAVTITNGASGGSGSYKYANYYKETTSDKWTTIQKFTTDASVEFTPSKAGTYDVCSKVKDENGIIVKKYFTVTVTD